MLRYAITGKHVEHVWKIHVVKTTIKIFDSIKSMMELKQPSQFQHGLVYWKKNNKNECCDNAKRAAQFAEKFKPGHRSFLGPGDEDK